LIGYQQVLLVSATDFNSSTALLQRYESNSSKFYKVGTPITVNLGRNGLGWDNSALPFAIDANEPQKHEGDGRAPSGIFPIKKTFGRAKSQNSSMAYLQTTPNLICIDDEKSPFYNQLVKVDSNITTKSFEWMQRDDGLYTLGILIKHNPNNISGRGSCVFMHIQKGVDSPTSGCTSMDKKDLKNLIEWLKPEANPLLIQIPKSYCTQIKKLYPGTECQ
jgi:D-alanyl-D-alanine dipeptidase